MSVLTVWDFDWSMVEDNSDTWVIDRLGARPAFDALKEVAALPCIPIWQCPRVATCTRMIPQGPALAQSARTIDCYLPVAGGATSVCIRADC